jgi:hypothetical protein
MTLLGRREFLRRSAAATLILGFPFVGRAVHAADGPADPGDVLDLARTRIKEETKPGLVLLVPADPAAAVRMADELARLLDAGPKPGEKLALGEVPGRIGPRDGAVKRLFCQAIFVCLPAERARKEFSNLKADTAVVLLDLAGKPIDELKAEPGLYGKDFAEKMTDFLHGPEGDHLAATVAAQRAALGRDAAQQLDAGLRDLSDDVFATRQAANRQLSLLAPKATAALAAALRERPALDLSRRLERLFVEVYNDALTEKPGARLPYGVQCTVVSANVCKCGHSSTPADTRLFLRFLTEKGR